MTTVTIKGFVHASKSEWNGKRSFAFFSCDMSATLDMLLVGPGEFTYEVPADFNPVAAEVAALQKQKAEVTRKFAEEVKRINERLAKLDAIEHNPSEVAA